MEISGGHFELLKPQIWVQIISALIMKNTQLWCLIHVVALTVEMNQLSVQLKFILVVQTELKGDCKGKTRRKSEI